MCEAAGSRSRSRSGHPEEKAAGGEDQEAEQVSVKERLAMYQAAVSSKESSASSSAVVRLKLTERWGGGGAEVVQTRSSPKKAGFHCMTLVQKCLHKDTNDEER